MNADIKFNIKLIKIHEQFEIDLYKSFRERNKEINEAIKTMNPNIQFDEPYCNSELTDKLYIKLKNANRSAINNNKINIANRYMYIHDDDCEKKPKPVIK